MCGHAVVGEKGVQEGAKHAPLRGPCVECHCGGCVVAYPRHLGVACKKVQYPIAEGGV